MNYEKGYPVLENDRDAYRRALEVTRSLFGEEGLLPDPKPLMGGEDFARYAEKVPALYAFLGAGAPEKGITAPNHAPDFDVDEEALPRGAAWFAGLAAL